MNKGTKFTLLRAKRLMIAILGDIHGDANILAAASSRAASAGASVLIQVGDFGVYDFSIERLRAVAEASPIPIQFIDGNHEDYRLLNSAWQNSGKLTYVRRGVVKTLCGLRVGFLGGAGSIDHAYRKAGRDWFPDDEQIKDHEGAGLCADGPVDILVTHTPPREIIDRYFDTSPEKARASRAMFGAAPDWNDPSADKVQAAWEVLGKPPLFCGHMHSAITDGNVRVLDIAELAFVPPLSERRSANPEGTA